MKKFVIPLLIFFLFSACKNETKKVTYHKSYSKCLVNQNYPYLNSPYPGIHGNEHNNERITCDGPVTSPVMGWHALKDGLIFNMATVSRSRIYAILTKFTGCKLWYVNLDDGSEKCLTKDPEILSPGVLGSSPELDEDENIYLADGFKEKPDGVYSFDKNGNLRWHTSFENLRKNHLSSYRAPFGVHFTPQGFVATVTVDGIVVLLDRDTGHLVASYKITEETNLRPIKTEGEERNFSSIPKYLQCRLQRIVGGEPDEEDLEAFFSGSIGESGAYTDNTIAGSGDLLFVVGGGPDEDGDGYGDTGALVAIKITKDAGGKTKLTLAWYMKLLSGSGTSPTVDPTGKYVVVSDFDQNKRARIVVADIEKCNRASNNNPPECQPAWVMQLKGKPLYGSVSMDEDGVVYAWNQGVDEYGNNLTPEVVAIHGPDSEHSQPYFKWTVTFPQPQGEKFNDTEWTSTVLVLNNIVVGTVTFINAIATGQEIFPLPTKLYSELVGIDRETGKILWSVPIPDDSFNAPLLGPDGNIYVPIFGILSLFKIPDNGIPSDCSTFVDNDYHGGIYQFKTGE